jgi:hypothetical protein
VVIGVVGLEAPGQALADTDTLNGAWSGGDGIATAGGQSASNVSISMQYKVVTATGAQTFNPGGGVSSDSVAIVFAMAPQPAAATGTASMTLLGLGNGFLVTNFYFHNTLTTVTGTLPPDGVSQSGVTYNALSSGSGVNAVMNSAKGAAQVSVQVATVAQTAEQKNWMGRFVSPPLPAQIIAAGTWQVNAGIAESDLNSNLKLVFGALYVWRPSTGLKVGDIAVGIANAAGSTTPSVAPGEVPRSVTVAGAALTVQEGDLLVYEAWFDNIQALATSYTNTFYFDGTTDLSNSNAASCVAAPAPLILATAPPSAPTQQPRNIHLTNAALQPAFTR